MTVRFSRLVGTALGAATLSSSLLLGLAGCSTFTEPQAKQDLVLPEPPAAKPSEPADAPAEPPPAADNSGGIKELQQKDVVVGKGAEAKDGDKVSVHYTGTLLDGTEFDSSIPRKTPFEFVLGQGQVIKGWDQGVKGMKVGGKRQLTIPPALAYGERNMGKIPSNSTLKFDVELLGVNGKK